LKQVYDKSSAIRILQQISHQNHHNRHRSFAINHAIRRSPYKQFSWAKLPRLVVVLTEIFDMNSALHQNIVALTGHNKDDRHRLRLLLAACVSTSPCRNCLCPESWRSWSLKDSICACLRSTRRPAVQHYLLCSGLLLCRTAPK